jgi:DNA-binding CsgD family transcriptional regulator
MADIQGKELTIPSRLPSKCLVGETVGQCRQSILRLIETAAFHDHILVDTCHCRLYVFAYRTGFAINGREAYLIGGMVEDGDRLEKSLELIRCVYALPVKAGEKEPIGYTAALSGPLGLLTQQELNTLRFIGRGLSNKDIAAKLFISINTVKVHISRLLQKLHLRNRTDAALFALKEGLLKKDDDIDA